MVEYDSTFYFNWGRDIRLDRMFFWSSHLRNATNSEFEEAMTMRAAGIADQFRLEVHTNNFAGGTSFTLRKNGNNSITSTVGNETTFSLLPGQTGEFKDDFPVNFLQNDILCWKFLESEGFQTMDFEIQCRLRFFKPPPFP